MTRERKTQIVTVTVLAAAFGIVVGQKYKWSLPQSMPAVVQPKADPAPQDAIYGMLDAARAGDVNAYVACYAGQMETALRQSLAETTEAKFSQYLKDSNAAIKGVAINEPQVLTDREMKVRVEYIYSDRNEAQTIYVEKTGATWRIARVEGAERVKTLVPYGTPVQ